MLQKRYLEMPNSSSRQLVLASTSPFRRALLERLGLPFETISPDVDETARDGEGPGELVMRLAESKAKAGAAGYPDALVIGSDQVACIDRDILGKPGIRARAIDQLEQASGRVVVFYTGLCLLDGGRPDWKLSLSAFHI